MIKKIFISILYLFIIPHAFCQWIKDFSGKPYRIMNENDIQGSPFLFEDWRLAKIKLKTLGEFDNIKVRFSTYNNRFYYNQNDSLYEFTDDIEEVRLKNYEHLNESGYDLVFRKDIVAGDKVLPGTFVQVLCNGTITVIKYYSGKIVQNTESSTYGSEGTTKKFVTTNVVLAITKKGIQNIQYSLKNLQLLTYDKWEEINNFIKSKNLNVKKEMGFTVAIVYYNLLSP